MVGTALQLAVLKLRTSALALDYMVAPALAVEFTILHNFAWHERFTWRERASASMLEMFQRFAQLNLSTGLISILGNLALMKLLAGAAHIDLLLANLVSVGACSPANFVVGDRLVFRAVSA